MAAPTFTVLNQDHDGTGISTITPVGGSLRWSYRMAQFGGPGDIFWDVALSDSALGTDDFAPLRTDWRLLMNGAYVLQGGLMTSVNTGSDPSGIFGVVHCAGLDWLHYLEQPYPFDFENVAADIIANQLTDDAQLQKVWAGATQETVVGDLIDSVSGYEDAPAFSAIFDGTGWSNTLDKAIEFGDTTTILEHIVGVASFNDPRGFDMWVEEDKSIRMTAPRFTVPTSVSPIYTLNDANVVVPPLDWTNNGPLATDTVARETTATNTSRIGFSKYQASRDTYRRWVRIADIQIGNTTLAAAAADGIGYEDRFPHKDLKITIRPDLLDSGDETAGFYQLIGQPIAVNYNISPYHTINANFWILEQAFYQPDACNWLCDLTLSQIYGVAATPTP